MNNNNFLTLKDSANLIGVNERTMKLIIEKNKDKLNCSKLGRRYFINKEKLLNLLNNTSINY